MGCAFHKTGIGGVDLLQPRQLRRHPFIKEDRHGVPPAVRDEAAVKDVKTKQALDAKVRAKKILQFGGGKEVKAHCNTASVTELDLAPVQTMVEFEALGPFDRVIDVHVGNLRRKLGPAQNGERIKTVRGSGYILAVRPEAK